MAKTPHKVTLKKARYQGWEGQVDPARTSIPGVFSAGTATGPLDIPDSILHAGAAAAQTAAYLEMMKRKP